jgi:hypothetical protein
MRRVGLALHDPVTMPSRFGLSGGLTARPELARELHYSGDATDSASMNIWLHKQVMQKLAYTCHGEGQHRRRRRARALGGIIFFLLGIQGSLLWGVVMAILSLLPAVGAALIWMPATVPVVWTLPGRKKLRLEAG